MRVLVLILGLGLDLFLSGDFGRILLGSENSAGYLMHVSSPNVGLPINSGSNSNFIAITNGILVNRSPGGSTAIEAARDNDSEKITYFTPRFNGFQLGVSYAPELVQDDTAQQTRTLRYINGLTVGANYTGEFDGVEVNVSGGFFYAEQGSGFPNVANVAGVDTTDDHARTLFHGPARNLLGPLDGDGHGGDAHQVAFLERVQREVVEVLVPNLHGNLIRHQ